MKVAIASTFVPFINGGARNIVDWLEEKLVEKGHNVEVVYIPQVDNPETMLSQMSAIRSIDLSSADVVICIRPQAHLIQHPRKVVWFIHHLRLFYDLWDSEYRFFPDNAKFRELREIIHLEDSLALSKAHKIFTNSKVVQKRLAEFNKLPSVVLYPPLLDSDAYSNNGLNDEIVYLGRVEEHKRQHLFIEAMSRVHGPGKLRIVGKTSSLAYEKRIRELIDRFGLAERVIFSNEWATEEEKIEYLSRCRAVIYAPLDEDSYGYPSLEAAYSEKPILTTSDSGGVLEFVQHMQSGLISKPGVYEISQSIERLLAEPELCASLGKGAKKRVAELRISWDRVIEEVLS